ncbi:glycosyltransferase family 4 protein [Myxosarcina sp. GI1(2024)]
MFKITIDATPITTKPSGIGLYVANLIYYLNKLQTEENFHLGIVYQPGMKNWLTGRWKFPQYLQKYENLYFLPLPVTVSNLLAKFPNPILPYLEKSFGFPDIVHGTNYVVYPCQKSLRVMTIHDLTCIKYPQYTDVIVKTYSDRIKQCLQWTDLVITVSQATKRDIIEHLGVPGDRIYVTPQASRYSPNYLSFLQVERLEKEVNYDFSLPYLLFVSTIEPRKNINNLIVAFNYLKQRYQLEHQLVLIGQKGWLYQSIFQTIANSPWKQEIHYLGYLSDAVVALFYSQADVFVYPSVYEGFGLPVLEAMTLGTPVVTSNTSSLPEVAGKAALLVDPQDPMQLADAILQLVTNSQLRQQLIFQGKQRASLFSWERTARTTLEAYKSLL